MTCNALKKCQGYLFLQELFSNFQHPWCIFRHDIYIFINNYKTRVIYLKRILRLSIHVLSQLILTFLLNCVLNHEEKHMVSLAHFYQSILLCIRVTNKLVNFYKKIKVLIENTLKLKKLFFKLRYCNLYYWVFSFVHDMFDDILWNH